MTPTTKAGRALLEDTHPDYRRGLSKKVVAIEREAATEAEALRAALESINGIRNSIVGTQTVNWSEHIYPLVEALNAAGFKGLSYPEAKANIGTVLERLANVTAEAEALRAALKFLSTYEKRVPEVMYDEWAYNRLLTFVHETARAALATPAPAAPAEPERCVLCGERRGAHGPAGIRHPFGDAPAAPAVVIRHGDEHDDPDGYCGRCSTLHIGPYAPAAPERVYAPVDNTTLVSVSVGALAVAISQNERIKGALHEDDHAAAGSPCHTGCPCARAAVELVATLVTPAPHPPGATDCWLCPSVHRRADALAPTPAAPAEPERCAVRGCPWKRGAHPDQPDEHATPLADHDFETAR